LVLDARYTVNAKALRRWADERLVLEPGADGTIAARFRYDGTTCSNMGRAFRFEYTVTLGSRDAGYPVLAQRCAPAEDDEGHRAMCRYLKVGGRLLDEVAEEQPLLGRALDAVLGWHRAPAGPSCYCEREARTHKWGLVLETIHFALARRERAAAGASPLPGVERR
ncbi:MAG TPA: hypothetical protein VEA99_15735, partial [Gemmatimonadaceae bacterium]|nr:hypothetical protein [Gemmatimonadaceae bacterium]